MPEATPDQVATETEAAVAFAKNAVALRFEDLPDDVVDMTKKSILDTTGVIIPASTTSPEARALVDLVLDMGGNQEATLLGFGASAPAWLAGYVNGAMVNCQDFSDLHPRASHISSPVVPAAIALAQREGGISGREFITAVALGVDLHCRFTRAVGTPSPWHPAPAFGVFSAALACSKLLNLDESQTVDALGLAFIQSAGTQEIVFGKGTSVRGFGHAVPGEVGVRAALMARAGIGGVRQSLDGQYGFWNVYYDGKHDRDLLLGDLGTRYDVLENGFKPWPSCAFTHVHIDMVRELVREHHLTPDDVETITVTVGDFARGQIEPLEEWRRPTNTMLAKLSIPFNVAVAMQRSDVTVGDFGEEDLHDRDLLDMADRVEYVFDPQYNFVSGAGFPGGSMEILTRGGRRLTRQQPHAFGHPMKPMSWDQLEEKFRGCAGYAAVEIPEANLDQVTRDFRALQEVDDVREVFGLLG